MTPGSAPAQWGDIGRAGTVPARSDEASMAGTNSDERFICRSAGNFRVGGPVRLLYGIAVQRNVGYKRWRRLNGKRCRSPCRLAVQGRGRPVALVRGRACWSPVLTISVVFGTYPL